MYRATANGVFVGENRFYTCHFWQMPKKKRKRVTFVSINSTNLVVLVVPWYHLLPSFPCLRSDPEDLLFHRSRLCRLYPDHLYRRFYQGGQGHPAVRRDLEGLADRLAQELPTSERKCKDIIHDIWKLISNQFPGTKLLAVAMQKRHNFFVQTTTSVSCRNT